MDPTERLHLHFSLFCIGEGNGNPLQFSCLGNPRDGGAWRAAVCGVPQSRTRLKRLSSSSSSKFLGDALLPVLAPHFDSHCLCHWFPNLVVQCSHPRHFKNYLWLSPTPRMDWLDLLAVQGTRVFSNTTVQTHQFFGAQPSSQSNSHIHTCCCC